MTDLHTRLVEVVTARLELARAATPGPWMVDEHVVGYRIPRRPLAGSIDAGTRENAAHIAASDPATVIRHALADLRRLERHALLEGDRCMGCYDAKWGEHALLADCPEIEDIRLAHAIEIEVPDAQTKPAEVGE